MPAGENKCRPTQALEELTLLTSVMSMCGVAGKWGQNLASVKYRNIARIRCGLRQITNRSLSTLYCWFSLASECIRISSTPSLLYTQSARCQPISGIYATIDCGYGASTPQCMCISQPEHLQHQQQQWSLWCIQKYRLYQRLVVMWHRRYGRLQANLCQTYRRLYAISLLA